MNEPTLPSASPCRWADRAEWWLGGLCALGLLALTFLLVPDYWRVRGFPLDDAWIHAVYARSVAHGQGLSYNPGIPATGETSPLWALVLALVHLASSDVTRVVLLTKLVGFLLHVLTAAGWYLALRAWSRRQAASAALLVLLSPPLVAASLSGMEVPLATLATVCFLLALRSPRPTLYVLCGALGPLARPEVGLFLFLLPLVTPSVSDGRGVARRWLQAGVGVLLGGGAWAAWNLYASGRPLPATFYAKVNAYNTPRLEALWVGFTRILPVTSWPGPVLLLLGGGALWVVLKRRSASEPERLAAGFVLAGGVFCFTSALLLRSPRADSFYIQRYVLPAVPLLLVCLPLMLSGWVEARLARHGPRLPSLIAAALPLVLLPGLDSRLEWLENDAHNIDDLQVQEGLFLAQAAPTDTVWVLDAGASRFFGQAFVVDMVGLNTPRLLDEGAQTYLDAHPPRFFDWTEGWASVQADVRASVHAARRFKTSTPYTTSPSRTMAQRVLLECAPGSTGYYLRKTSRWHYQCAAGTGAALGEPAPAPSLSEGTPGP